MQETEKLAFLDARDIVATLQEVATTQFSSQEEVPFQDVFSSEEALAVIRSPVTLRGEEKARKLRGLIRWWQELISKHPRLRVDNLVVIAGPPRSNSGSSRAGT